MSEDQLSGIGAHRLLNSVSAIHGLISVARSLHAADPGNAEIDRLLLAAEERANRVAEDLHQHVRGLPDMIDLDSETSAADAPEDDQHPPRS